MAKHPNEVSASRQPPFEHTSRTSADEESSADPTARKKPQASTSLLAREHLTTVDIERLAKILGAATITLYIVGLLGVNTYLFGLGASDFNLTRVRFVYTGVLTMSVLALTYFGPRGAVQILKHRAPIDSKSRAPLYKLYLWSRSVFQWSGRIILAFFAYLIPLAIFALLIQLHILDTTGENKLAEPLVIAGVLYLFGYLLCYAILEIARSMANRELDDAVYETPTPPVMWALGVAFVALVFMGTFSSNIYPAIPEQFGGGSPVRVHLLIAKDSIEQVKELGIPMSSQGTISGSVDLVYQGDRMYIIRLDNGRVIQVKADIINGLARPIVIFGGDPLETDS
jgi:hypothetical protein